MYPIFRMAKKMDTYKKSVHLNEDTLMVNRKPYTVDTIADLPADLHPSKLCEKSTDEVFVFGGLYSEFSKHSNWSTSPFTFKDRDYVCLEQGYMYNKAVTQGDTEAARKISCTKDPREIKRLGSAIVVKNEQKWNTAKIKLMLELVRAKYTQNPHLKQLLLETGDRKLGETGRDSFFSIGLPLTHPSVLDSGAWKSRNELGKALEIVRREFRNA